MNKYNPFDQSNKEKKEVATDSQYQSTFLPLFQKAETFIKYVIVYYFLNQKSRNELRLRIMTYIKELEKKIPTDLQDREKYINGLFRKADAMISYSFSKPQAQFIKVVNTIQNNIPSGYKIPKINTPKDLVDVVTNRPGSLKINLWAEQKASPQVLNYAKEIDKYINNISNTAITTAETDAHSISLWQKAELDLRHKKQEDNYNKLLNDGVKYAWISSHPDCSKRCEKWQGKLFNIDPNAHSELSGFRMREKLDGHTVYCFNDIASQVDKYGYTNNIIVGFNCRHYFIPYVKGEKPTTDYSAKDIAKERDIETKIRAMEREIRQLKTDEKLVALKDSKKALMLRRKIKVKIAKYKAFCNANGYAWYQYRINI